MFSHPTKGASNRDNAESMVKLLGPIADSTDLNKWFKSFWVFVSDECLGTGVELDRKEIGKALNTPSKSAHKSDATVPVWLSYVDVKPLLNLTVCLACDKSCRHWPIVESYAGLSLYDFDVSSVLLASLHDSSSNANVGLPRDTT